MAVIRPFRAVRPAEGKASQVAALPYDVYNRKEAAEEVKDKPLSFLNIDRAETQFGDDVDTYDDRVYKKARELYELRKEDKTFIQEEKPCYYVYQLTMDGRTQTGLVAVSSIDDYADNVIKKHENTREDKELDRIRHVDTVGAQTGPIFLAYRADNSVSEVIKRVKGMKPLYEFEADDGIKHAAWKISDETDINTILTAFENINSIYIADGHHRAASAVKVGFKKRKEHPEYDGTEEFNYFLSVLFPDEELMIMPYNRVVKDLNGLTVQEYMDKISESFEVQDKGTDPYSPGRKGVIGMYLEGSWYALKAKECIKSEDPVEGLDVSLLQNHLLKPVLGIDDPRTDERIDFIGGIRGLKELERRCGSDMEVAFSMYPTSIHELFSVSDAGLLMPPKSTWFEPKLRSGLFIHEIE